MAVWKLNEDSCGFERVPASEIEVDPDAHYVLSDGFGELTVRYGDASPVPFPSDDRLSIAGLEFTSDDFLSWDGIREIASCAPPR